MFTNRNHRKYVTSIVASLVIALISASVACAAFISINTNDGLNDSNWPTTPTITDPNEGSINDNYDILNFWVGTDAATPGMFYFRAELAGILPSCPGCGDFLEARLDCDNDGDFFEAADILVEYIPENDGVYVYNGDISTYDTESLSVKGEKTSTNAYEWRAPTTGGNVNWTTCRTATTISVMLATVKQDLTDQDVTTSRGYNVPTVITLHHFDSASTNTNHVVMVSAGILFVVGFVLANSMWRGRKRDLPV